MTPFSSKCEILADLWMNYRDDDEFVDFVEYNDLGLPLAYAVTNNIATVTDNGTALISETWDLFLSAQSLEDTGFESLDDIFDTYPAE